MGDSLVTLLYQIRTLILVASVVLSVGSMIGILVKGNAFFTEKTAEEAQRDRPARPHQARKSIRVKSDSILELKDPDTGEYEAGTAYLHNLSLEGACFDSRWLLKIGKTLEARLHSSKEGALHVTATVVWTIPARDRMLYGVHFQNVTPMSHS